jgi:hypothetical protein
MLGRRWAMVTLMTVVVAGVPYTIGDYTHAVIIYRLSDRGNISYMDPNGGYDRWQPVTWFQAHGPYVLMRRA